MKDEMGKDCIGLLWEVFCGRRALAANIFDEQFIKL